MSEPERLLESGSALARRLLESGTVERPPSASLARTMATLSVCPGGVCPGGVCPGGVCPREGEQRSEVRSRTRGRVSGVRERWIVRGARSAAGRVGLRSRVSQWPLLVLLATVSLVVSAVLSYRWRAAPPSSSSGAVVTQGAALTTAGPPRRMR